MRSSCCSDKVIIVLGLETKICEISSVVTLLHLEPISTDDKALFTVSLHTVPMINGFLSLFALPKQVSVLHSIYMKESTRVTCKVATDVGHVKRM
jgi:hypothetical protein